MLVYRCTTLYTGQVGSLGLHTFEWIVFMNIQFIVNRKCACVDNLIQRPRPLAAVDQNGWLMIIIWGKYSKTSGPEPNLSISKVLLWLLGNYRSIVESFIGQYLLITQDYLRTFMLNRNLLAKSGWISSWKLNCWLFFESSTCRWKL